MGNHSITIIGAGPAGATASLFLAKEKIPHTIIDKAFFPRDKVCGDALSGKVLPILKKINPTFLEEIANDKETVLGSFGIKFAAPNGKSIDIPFKSVTSKVAYAPGFISKRIDFDNFLISKIDKQYAEFLQGTELIDFIQKGNGIELRVNCNGEEKMISSKLVICCDGDRSVIAKKAGGKIVEDKHYCGGIRAYYKNVSGMHEQNYVELHFIKELLPGYFWIFPLPNGMTNVGAGMLSESLSKKKVNLREAMLKAIAENATIKNRFANAELVGKIVGWGLPLGSKKRKISGERFMLCGDAASLIDPFTGEGISNAMYCGMVAAETAKESLNQNRFDSEFLKKYDENIYNRLWSELKLSHTLQKLCNYPRLFNFVVNKAERNQTFRETISCMFDDLDLREKLRKPSFYFKLLFD
ncbi:MAG: NAD(P)/FAD-dependent oxidoreductase [Bacteroidia bacterium]